MFGASPWVWTVNPLQLAPLLVGAAMYAVRARTLARRGRRVPRPQVVAFASGVALILIAFVSPIDYLGEERLLFAHMVQHILLGDLGALLIVLGLTGPILRPVLALPAVGRLRVLAHPLVALPLWALNLYLWHIPALYQAALDYSAVHALQHLLFFGTGAAMWAAVVEPIPGPAWFGTGPKVVYILAVRLLETVLANMFIWSGRPFYERYAEAPRVWGISPLADQNTGGAIMMTTGSIVTVVALAWLFLRWLAEGEREQALVEGGTSAEAARRAVRYGRSPPLGPGGT